MEEFLRKALYVEDKNLEDVDYDVAPTSGQEYLKHVITEARKCEPVVVANIPGKKLKAQTIKYSNDSGCSQPPEDYLPSKEWQQYQVFKFSELRRNFVKYMKKKDLQTMDAPSLPAIDNEEQWSMFCYGVPQNEQNDDNAFNGTPPLLKIMVTLNQVKIETLLEYNIRWLEEGKEFCQRRGQWLYSLLVKLEKPLTPEVCSLLRDLARLCSSIRAKLKSPEDIKLAQMNLFICLISRYFDQGDLADPI